MKAKDPVWIFFIFYITEDYEDGTKKTARCKYGAKYLFFVSAESKTPSKVWLLYMYAVFAELSYTTSKVFLLQQKK